MAVLGLRFCVRAFSSCGKWGPLFIAVHRPLTVAASLVVGHRLQMRRLSNCGSPAQSLHGMWDLPGPGLEPVSPALAGTFSTTVPPGKPSMDILTILILPIHEHGLSSHLIVPSLISFISVLNSFHCTGHSPPWLNLFLGILFFLIQWLMGSL